MLEYYLYAVLAAMMAIALGVLAFIVGHIAITLFEERKYSKELNNNSKNKE